MENLKLLRTKKGYSQQKLADLLNTSQQSIHKYENDISQPDIQMLKQLSAIFDTSIDYLVGNASAPDKYDYLRESDLSAHEQEHLSRYRALSKKRQELIDSIIDDYNEGQLR